MPLKNVLRWGRSAYESDEALAFEERAAISLGLAWSLREDRSPPDVSAVDALVVNSGVRVDADVLSAMRGDLVVATTSGFDHIDLSAAAEHGVTVVRCPEARRDAVVEQAIGSMIALMRRVPALQQAALDGSWARGAVTDLAPLSLRDGTVVVVGLGVIGTRIADLLLLMGANVIGVDPVATPAGIRTMTLQQALPLADAVTLHCSLTDSSRDLLNAAALDLLPEHAVVVNTARGDVLDVSEVVDRVRDGRLRGAAVDVFPEEPYPALAEGAAVEGVLFTPHSAGYTDDLGARVAASVAVSLMTWKAGKPQPHRVEG